MTFPVYKEGMFDQGRGITHYDKNDFKLQTLLEFLFRRSQPVVTDTISSAIAQGTAVGWGLDADADMIGLNFDIPDFYVPADSAGIRLYWEWVGEGQIPDTKKVIFDVDYRVKALTDLTDLDAGNATSLSVTHTQSGDGVAGERHISYVELDADDADNPLTPGQRVYILFTRDVTTEDTASFAADAVVLRFWLEYL